MPRKSIERINAETAHFIILDQLKNDLKIAHVLVHEENMTEGAKHEISEVLSLMAENLARKFASMMTEAEETHFHNLHEGFMAGAKGDMIDELNRIQKILEKSNV